MVGTFGRNNDALLTLNRLYHIGYNSLVVLELILQSLFRSIIDELEVQTSVRTELMEPLRVI
jgi:hypothetical protein